MEAHTGSATKSDLASLAAAARDGLLTIDEVPRALELSRRDAAVRLSRLAKAGWLARVRRGLYYVLPVDAAGEHRTTYPDSWLLASRAFAPCYIGGWTAAEHWGLTEQLFTSTFVASAAALRSRRQVLLGLQFELALVRADRVEGLRGVWRGTSKVLVSGAERTLVDGCRDPAWLGGIRHAAECLRRYLEGAGDTGVESVVLEALRSGNGAARKRLGFLLEREGCATDSVAPLRESLTSGRIRLDPAVRMRGRIDSRWGLFVNVDAR